MLSACRCRRTANNPESETISCDKGYAGREFEQAVSELGGLIVRPARKNEPATRSQPASDSTTTSDDPAAQSPTTPPRTVASII